MGKEELASQSRKQLFFCPPDASLDHIIDRRRANFCFECGQIDIEVEKKVRSVNSCGLQALKAIAHKSCDEGNAHCVHKLHNLLLSFDLPAFCTINAAELAWVQDLL